MKRIVNSIFEVSEKHTDMLLRCPLYSNQISTAYRNGKKMPVHCEQEKKHNNVYLRQNILNENDPNSTVSIMKGLC